MAHWTAAPSTNRRKREQQQAEFERIHNETPEVCPCHSCAIKKLKYQAEKLEQKMDALETFIKKMLEEQLSSPKSQQVGPSGDSSPRVDWQESIEL